MIAHFFDIDTLIKVNSNIWVVSKDKPFIPILKITQSEFNLIKKGIYKSHNSSLEINSTNYWLPKNLLDILKIRCKKHNYDITNLSFSMQEFLNTEVISNLDYEIFKDHIIHLKNKSDDIYVICSKKSEKSYQPIISKLEEEFNKIGMKITKFYFISETFYNRNKDEISHRKVRLLLQQLIGLKTDIDKFTNNSLKNYDLIYYYTDNYNSLKLAKDSNQIFHFLLNNSDSYVKDIIKQILKSSDKSLIVREVTHNKVNIFKDKEINLTYTHIKKTFESFKLK